MRRLLPLLALTVTPMLISAQAPQADPNLYLENIHGPRALAMVKQWNTRTLRTLEAEPGFAQYQQRALALLQDDRQLATPDQIIGDQVLNLWQDKANPRGLWRIASLDSFAAGTPQWRTLIDVDALGKAEGKSWVWKGATCRKPDYDRCMVALSDGGGDAVVVREFDIPSGTFVDGGFTIPNAKTNVTWAGPDALYVGTDFGAGSLTDSGYPRIVKLWKRGTPLSAATTVGSGAQSDVSVNVRVLTEGDHRYPILEDSTDFYHAKRSHIAPDGTLIPVPLPSDALIDDVLDGRLIATLMSDWNGMPAGSVIVYAIDPVLAGKDPQIETVFRPNAHQAVEQVAASKAVLWIKLLDDVSGRLIALTRQDDGRWQQ